jgi:hypothetical protein
MLRLTRRLATVQLYERLIVLAIGCRLITGCARGDTSGDLTRSGAGSSGGSVDLDATAPSSDASTSDDASNVGSEAASGGAIGTDGLSDVLSGEPTEAESVGAPDSPLDNSISGDDIALDSTVEESVAKDATEEGSESGNSSASGSSSGSSMSSGESGGGCASETNAVFCSRLGKNCGQLTNSDNCGQPRTVASCGTCTAPHTCGGGGTANVCGGGAACSPAYSQSNCLEYVAGIQVSTTGHNWFCSDGNCRNCSSYSTCAPGATGCPWGVVWTDMGPCQ